MDRRGFFRRVGGLVAGVLTAAVVPLKTKEVLDLRHAIKHLPITTILWEETGRVVVSRRVMTFFIDGIRL